VPADVQETVETLQAELDVLRQESEHLGRLATLGTLAATLSHEFNNILTPASNYARLGGRAIAAPVPSSADLELARKALRKCEVAAGRAAKLATTVLDLARPASESNRPACKVHEAVTRAVEALGRSPEQDGIRCEIRVPADLETAMPMIELEHVLVNLLLNARRSMLSGRGRRRLLVEWSDERLVVADTGSGIDPAVLPRLFSPFASGRDGGSGLGLSSCRRILLRAGGQIELARTGPGGTRFALRLPESSPTQASQAA
jgi:signal transduction histidine kinase